MFDKKLLPILFVLLAPGAVSAAIHFIDHNSDTFGNAGLPGSVETITDSSPINYSFSGVTNHFTPANTAVVNATSGQGFVGITATATRIGSDVPQRQEVRAGFTFDVVFGSAGAGTIDVVMNMLLSGVVTLGNNNSKFVSVFAGPSSGTYIESPGEPTDSTGMLSSFSDDGTDHLISTNPFSVPVNVPVALSFQLLTSQAYGTVPGSIDFGSTLSLSTVGDVFTIGGTGVTVNSLDAGIVNNRYSIAAVPEPASLFVWSSLGLTGVLAYRRRRRK